MQLVAAVKRSEFRSKEETSRVFISAQAGTGEQESTAEQVGLSRHQPPLSLLFQVIRHLMASGPPLPASSTSQQPQQSTTWKFSREMIFKEISGEDDTKLDPLDPQIIERAERILDATKEGNLGELERLMEDVPAISVNFALSDYLYGRTPLHIAATFGHVQIIRWIRESGHNRNMNAMDNRGYTPLQVALLRNRLPDCSWNPEMARAREYWMDEMVDEKVVDELVRELLMTGDTDANAGNGTRETPLLLAFEGGYLNVVRQLLGWKPTDGLQQGKRIELHEGENWKLDGVLKYMTAENPDIFVRGEFGNTVLHYAARKGLYNVVRQLLGEKVVDVNSLNNNRETPLHLAVMSASPRTVKVFLRNAEHLKVSEPDWPGTTPIEIARSLYLRPYKGVDPFGGDPFGGDPFGDDPKELRRNIEETVTMLEGFDVQGLRNDRQVYVDSANSILVGAALIASVTFAAWLQPPLGYLQYYSDEFVIPGAPPGTYQTFVAIKQHWAIQLFWVFNSLSFFFAIATVVAGADAALPTKGMMLIHTVKKVRHAVLRASFLLFLAIVCVTGAFATAGFTVLPPIDKYRMNMVGTVCVGGFVCFVVLVQFLLKLTSWIQLQEQLSKFYLELTDYYVRYVPFTIRSKLRYVYDAYSY